MTEKLSTLGNINQHQDAAEAEMLEQPNTDIQIKNEKINVTTTNVLKENMKILGYESKHPDDEMYMRRNVPHRNELPPFLGNSIYLSFKKLLSALLFFLAVVACLFYIFYSKRQK